MPGNCWVCGDPFDSSRGLRCRCRRQEPPSGGHKARCTCFLCHYGVAYPQMLARDGVGKPVVYSEVVTCEVHAGINAKFCPCAGRSQPAPREPEDLSPRGMVNASLTLDYLRRESARALGRPSEGLLVD